MRNNYTWATDCGPIIGEIRHGKRYPDGSVSADDFEEEISAIEADITSLKSSVTNLQNSNEILSGNITTLTTQYNNTVPGMSNDITALKIQAANTQNTANNALAAVSVLESKETELRAGMNANSQEISGLSSSVTAINSNVSTLTSDIRNVETRMTNLEVSLSNLRNQQLNTTNQLTDSINVVSGDVSTLRSSVTSMQSQLNSYINATDTAIANLSKRVADLEASGDVITINTLTATPSLIAKGTSASIALAWTLTGTAASQTINGVSVTGTSYTANAVTSDTTYTLVAKTASGKTATKSTSVKFANYIYWGSSANTTINAALISGLQNNVLSNDPLRTVNITSNNEYVYYAYPKRLGSVAFEVSGFTGGFQLPVVVSYLNSAGYTEDYYVYQSNRILSGEATYKIKGA